MGFPQLRGTEVYRPVERDRWMAERARKTAALDAILRRSTGGSSLAATTTGGTGAQPATVPATTGAQTATGGKR